MRDPRRGPEREDVAAAAALAVPFALYTIALHLAVPPTRAQWAAADPILHLVPAVLAVWGPPLAGIAVAVAWWRVARPDRATLRAALRDGLVGAAVGAGAVLALRGASGPHLPAFIPAEESAAPGFGLSMTAGYAEEVACRFALLPLLHFGLRGRLRGSAPVSILLTGLFFSLWHAAGEPGFSAPHFLTRLLIPGCAMSAAWMASPSAIVAAHCTAHLLVPALFV